MKRLVLFILSLSLLGGIINIQTVSAEEDYEIPEESIISGDGSEDNPYVVDEKTETFLLNIAFKENELNSTSKPGMRKAKGVSGTETLTKILTGKAHKKQTKGGYWLYKSSKPNVIYNGMIWMRKIQYVNKSDTVNIYAKMTKKQRNTVGTFLKNSLLLGSSILIDRLVKKGIERKVAVSIMKLLGWTSTGLKVYTAADIIKQLNDSMILDIYSDVITKGKGVILTKFMTSYQGQWYAHTSTEVWTNYSTAKEPNSAYGKGTYKSY